MNDIIQMRNGERLNEAELFQLFGRHERTMARLDEIAAETDDEASA